jgi:type II secretory pathway pseudopilin PulG
MRFTFQRRPVSAFTMMEIAISLAVIGIALVAIIGVLPIGMNVQQANRQETVISQDASVLLEAIRNGSLGYDDLTNYVYAISNYWGQYNSAGTVFRTGVNGYTYALAYNAPGYPELGEPITNGANIIGLLSTPEFFGAPASGRGGPSIAGDVPGEPIPSLMFGGISNHIVAYCYSISGPAVEKPPQDNSILHQDSFGYRIYCVNAPTATDTNLFSPLWTPGSYTGPSSFFYNWTYWNLPKNVTTTQIPGNPPVGIAPDWQMSPNYNLELALNLHELRLTFEWPQLPNGKLGPGRETFRTTVAGQLLHQPNFSPSNPNILWDTNLYCYMPQTFTNTP